MLRCIRHLHCFIQPNRRRSERCGNGLSLPAIWGNVRDHPYTCTSTKTSGKLISPEYGSEIMIPKSQQNVDNRIGSKSEADRIRNKDEEDIGERSASGLIVVLLGGDLVSTPAAYKSPDAPPALPLFPVVNLPFPSSLPPRLILLLLLQLFVDALLSL